MKKSWIMVPVISLCLFFAASIGAGAVYAHYSSSQELGNRLITKGSGVVLKELFNRDDEWLPGETKTKKVWFGNEADTPQVIRFRADSAWKDSAGNAFAADYTPQLHWTTALVGADGDPATPDEGQQWTQIGEYYYYNRVLQPGTESSITRTDDVLSAVTFDGRLSNDAGHNKDYSDKHYTLTITMEAVNVDSIVVAEAWDVTLIDSGSTLSWSPST